MEDDSDCRIEVSDLSAATIASVEDWSGRLHWPWVDAVAWAAAQDRDTAIVLTAVRADYDERHGAGDGGVTDGALDHIASSRLGGGRMGRGRVALLQALRNGRVSAIGAVDQYSRLEPIDPADWIDGEVNYGNSPYLRRQGVTFTQLYERLHILGSSLLREWPIRRAEPALAEERPLSRRPKQVTVSQRLLGETLAALDRAGLLDKEPRKSVAALHALYVDYLRRTNKAATPIRLTAFKKWLSRFRNGEHSKGYWQPK